MNEFCLAQVAVVREAAVKIENQRATPKPGEEGGEGGRAVSLLRTGSHCVLYVAAANTSSNLLSGNAWSRNLGVVEKCLKHFLRAHGLRGPKLKEVTATETASKAEDD